ncbi:uncharacterized protein K444DRAFT_695455 [Hyaloscypha bicolor E]|uniref:DDE-1 domain-containing protein n=1 Tax=Hyaloscypha bicolor E TaxID=1095630 RepID=A0A2J6SZ15_9HELO|nr:uncharacterized protein K444DRAFT_695455 [Hyaloscypha bicolor E]PMD56020.1 hypothetical protein K444DRAFT_695455 [Hyaloscypha bicolor E]
MRNTTIITHKNIKHIIQVFIKDPIRRELVIAIEYISTSFWELDPFIIIPDSIFIQKHFNNNLAPNVKIATSENGYTDDKLAYKWLWHFHYQTKL